jgi:chromosome segregation ATPase
VAGLKKSKEATAKKVRGLEEERAGAEAQRDTLRASIASLEKDLELAKREVRRWRGQRGEGPGVCGR